MQPLDVSINKPFKSKMREQRSDWFDKPDKLTQNGNLKRASYGSVKNWVHESSISVSDKIIKKSFWVCGLCFLRDLLILNERLSDILGNAAKRVQYVEDLDLERDDKEFAQEIANRQEIDIIEPIDSIQFE